MDLERYAIVVSAAVEADELVLDLDKSTLEELEAKLNQELAGTDQVGEQAGKELAEGLERGAVEGLDVRQVLAKLKAALKGEVRELATEEVKALRAAIQHALGVELDDNAKRQLAESAKLLDRIIESATRNQSLTVKLRFDADRSALLTAERLADAYLNRIREALKQDKSSPLYQAFSALAKGTGEKLSPDEAKFRAGLFADVRDRFLALLKQDLQSYIADQLKRGHAVGDIKLPDTQAILSEAGLPTLKQALLLSRAVDLDANNRAKLAKDLGQFMPEVAQVLKAPEKGASWEEINAVVREAKKAIHDAEEARRIALSLRSVTKEGNKPFAQQTGRFHTVELQEEGSPDEFQELLRLQASTQGHVDETTLARLVVQKRATKAILKKLLETADRPEEQAVWRSAIERLVIGNTAYDLKDDESFAKLIELAKKHPLEKVVKNVREVQFSEKVTLSDKYAFVPASNQGRIFLSHLRRENIYRTPTQRPLSLKVAEEGEGVRLKEMEEKALGDGALGILRPQSLGLPEDYTGVVQVRGELADPEGNVYAGLKGTVIVDPRAKEDFLNLNDLYRGDTVVDGKKYTKEEVDALIREKLKTGALQLNLGIHRVSTVEEAKVGKQVFLRHMGGVPFNRGRISPSEAAKWAAQAKELKFLPMIAGREMGLSHYQQIATLAKTFGVEVDEGQYSMAASHTAYKELDPEIYRLLEEGVELDAEGRPIVPIVIGKEMAAKLGLKEGDVAFTFRNPVMGHGGALLQARVAAIRDRLNAVVVNQEYAKSTGVDFDGDTLVVLPKGLPVDPHRLEVFQTLMAHAGLAGGRKGGGSVEPSPGELRFKEQLEVYDKVLARLSKSRLAAELRNAGVEDLSNPFEVVRQLESLGEEELLKAFKGYLRKGFAKELGLDLKSEEDRARLNQYLFEGFLDYRKQFQDPRRVYKKLPLMPSAALAASLLQVEAHKKEYDPSDPVALAAGQLTTSFLGLSEKLAQDLETSIDFPKLAEAIRAYNQAYASGNEEQAAKARAELVKVLNDPTVQKFSLSNLLYQIITDRKKRDYSLRVRTESGKTYEYRNLYAVLNRLMQNLPIEEVADTVYDASGQAVEERVPPKQSATRSLVKGLLDLASGKVKEDPDGTVAEDLADLPVFGELEQLYGLVANAEYDLNSLKSALAKPKKPQGSYAEITTLLYRGIANQEGLAETNLPRDEVARRTADLLAKIADLKRAVALGELRGYEHLSRQEREEVQKYYLRMLEEQETLVKQSYKELVGGTLRSKLLESGFREKLAQALAGTKVSEKNLPEYVERLIGRITAPETDAELSGRLQRARKNQRLGVLNKALAEIFSDKDLGVGEAQAKKVLEVLRKADLLDPSLALKSGGMLSAAILPVSRLSTYLDLVQPPVAEVPEGIRNPELRSLLERLRGVSSHKFWSEHQTYGALVDRLAELLGEDTEETKLASRYVAEAFLGADVAYRVLPPTHLGELLQREVAIKGQRGKAVKALLGDKAPTLGNFFQTVYRPLWETLGNLLPVMGLVKRDGRVTNVGYEALGPALLMPESLVKGDTLAYADILAKYIPELEKAQAKFGKRGGVLLERVATGYLDERGKFVESEERRELSKYRLVVQGVNLGKRADSITALLTAAVNRVLPASASVDNLTPVARFNRELERTLLQAIQEAVEEPTNLGEAKALEALEEAVNQVHQAVAEEVKDPAVKAALEEAKERVLEALKAEAEAKEPSELEEVKEKARELQAAKEKNRERIRSAVARLRAGEAKLQRIQALKERQDHITGREPVDEKTLEAQAAFAARYATEAVERGQYDAAEQILESMKANPTVNAKAVEEAQRVVRNLASASGGGGGDRPPSKPPAPPPPPEPEDEERKRKERKVVYWPSVFFTEKEREALFGTPEKPKDFSWSVYRGLVRNQAEEELFRAIYLNSQRGQSSKLGFYDFVVEYPEVANAFFGPLRSFAGRETVLPEKYLASLAEQFDNILSAYEAGDMDTLTNLVEDLNISVKRMENASKILADLREFKRTGALPHGRNLHTASRDALYYRRLMSLGGKELERAVEEGDLDTVLKVADRARHVEERIKLVQNAISNSLAFMLSSTVMGLFGTIQQEFIKMDRQAKAVAALANMTGKEGIGKGLSQVANALNVAQEELTQALVSLSKEGHDPEKARETFARLKGVLDATGEGMNELVQLYKELDRVGVESKDALIKSVVKERVYLGEAAEVVRKLNLKSGEVKASDLDELIVAASRYYRSGVPLVIPESGAERRKRLEELVKEGRAIAASTPDAKTALEPTAMERLLKQAERTMRAVIEAAKPALAVIGSFLMALLKVLEGVAYVLSTPLGKVAVVAGTIYATLLAIMQIQKTFQVAEWVKSLMVGLQELNAELVSFLKNLVRAFTDGTFAEGLKNGPFGSLVQTLLGSLEAVFNHPKLREFGAALERVVKGAFERIKVGAGSVADLLRRVILGDREVPIGFVDPSSARMAELIRKHGWKGVVNGALPILGVLGAGAYQMAHAGDMNPFQHLLATAGNALMFASMFLPGGVLVRGLTLPLRALAGAAGAGLAFGVPFLAERTRRAKESAEANKEFNRALSIAGGPEALAKAVAGELTPALEKAGYNAENLGQILDAAMTKGSAKVKNAAREVKAMADSLVGVRRVMDGLEERSRKYVQEYASYFRFAGSNAFTTLTDEQLEVFNRLFTTELTQEPAYRVLTKGLNLRLQAKIVELFQQNFLEGPLSFVLSGLGIDQGKLLYEVAKVREEARQFSMVDQGYFPELFKSASLDYYTGRGLDYNLKNALMVELLSGLRGATLGETLKRTQGTLGLVGASTGFAIGTAILPGAGSFLGALLGYLLSQFASPYVAGLAQRYGNLNVVRPTGYPSASLRAALSVAGASAQVEADLVDALKTEGVKRAEAVFTRGLSAFRGKERVKARQAVEEAVKELNEYVSTVQSGLVKQYTLQALGFDFKARLEGGQAYMSLGGLGTRRIRSQLPELEAQYRAELEKLNILEAGFSKYLTFARTDSGVEVRIREGQELNPIAQAAFARAVEEVKDFGLNLAKLNDQLKQVRFAELLEQIAIKAEEAFVRRIGQIGQGAELVAGKLAMPESPFNAFLNRLVQNNLKDTGLFGDTRGGLASPQGFNPTSVFGGRVTQKPGEKLTNPNGHRGYDIALPVGTPIRWGNVEGKVLQVGYEEKGYGNYVAVQAPDGSIHIFAHLQELPKLKPGSVVKPGQVLGKSGNTGKSTGPHLHYEILSPNRVPVRDEAAFKTYASRVYGQNALSVPASEFLLDEKTLKEAELAWRKVMAPYFAAPYGTSVEKRQELLNRAVQAAQQDAAIRKAALTAFQQVYERAPKKGELEAFVRKVIYLSAEGRDLDNALILALSEAQARERETAMEKGAVRLERELYAPDKTITTFRFQREQAEKEFEEAKLRAKTEMETALAQLEARYKTDQRPVDLAYRSERQRILDRYKTEVARLQQNLDIKLAEIAYNELVYRLERETALIRNERERITRQLNALKAYREQNWNKLKANTNAELNKRIEELELQLAMMGPDFSALREAEVRANLAQMLTGLNRPNLALNVQKLAESVYNDRELTTEQKRKLGVNPFATSLQDLLLPGGLMEGFLAAGKVADKYADTTLPKLQAYKNRLAYAALQGTAYLLESPVELANLLQKKAEYMASELRKNPKVAQAAKALGVSVEELVGYVVENVLGGALREGYALARQAKQSALQLRVLGAAASPFFSDLSVDFQRRALEMEAGLEDLKRSPLDLSGTERLELIKRAEAAVKRAKEVAPILDEVATRYNRLQVAAFRDNLQGGRLLEAQLQFAESVLEDERLSDEERYGVLRSFGLSPEGLRQQIRDLVFQRQAEVQDFAFRLRQREQAVALFQRYGLSPSLEADLARAELEVQREREAALLEASRQREQTLRAVDTYSTPELLVVAQELGVPAEVEDLRTAVKEALKERFAALERAIQAGAEQASQEARFKVLRGNLQSGLFVNRVQAASKLLAEEVFKQALSPEELRTANYLAQLDGAKVDAALKALSSGEAVSDKLGKEEADLLAFLGVDLRNLAVTPELKKLLESPYLTDRRAGLQELLARLKGVVAPDAEVLTALQRELNTLTAQVGEADLQRALEDLNNSEVLRYGVGGTRAALEAVRQQMALVKMAAVRMGLPAEGLETLSEEQVEALAKKLNLNADAVRSLVRLYRDVRLKVQGLEREVSMNEYLRPADRLLFRYERLGVDLAYADIAAKVQAEEGLFGGMQEELFRLAGGKVDYQSLLGLSPNELSELFGVAPEVAQKILELARALDALKRQLEDDKVAQSVENLARVMAEVSRMLDRASQTGNFAQFLEARQAAFTKYSDTLEEGLARLGITEEDLYLTDDELKARGLGNRLPEVERLRQLAGLKRQARVDALSLELLTVQDIEGAKKVLQKYGLDMNAAMAAAPGTEGARLRETLMENPIIKRLLNLGNFAYGRRLGELAASGDTEAILQEFERLVQALDDSRFGNLKAMYRKGLDPGSFAQLAKMTGVDPDTANRLDLLTLAYATGLSRKVQETGDEIARRYDVMAPLFNGPFSAARLEILKLQELYAKYSESAEEAAKEGRLPEAEAFKEQAERVFKELLDAQKRYSLLIVREWNALLASMEAALKGSLKEAASAILSEVLFNRSGKELAKVDRKYKDEIGFTESELEEAKRQKQALEEKLRQGGLSQDEYIRTKELYEYYTRKVQELEDKVKRVKFEWEQARREVESLAEVLDRIIQKLGDAILDKFIGMLVDMLFEGLKVSWSGSGGYTGGATASASSSAPAPQGVATQSSGITAQSVQAGATTAAAVTASAVKPQGSASPQALPPELGMAFTGFAVGSKMGDGDNLAASIAGTMLGVAGQSAIGALVAGAGLEGAMMAGLGVLANPVAWLAVGAGVALGAAISSHLRADEFNRKNAGSATYGLYNPADQARRGAKLQVKVDVKSDLDPDKVAEEAKKAIAQEMRKEEYRGGLEKL
ncbi:tail length tape measure protein [Thermus phage P74-26]|uniref:Tape tail measure protein n=1 Tax=Thermus phage P74-26 TaxID=2914007 RepID=A7XXS4_BP742|nr:tail length tape measure protein [Thermus phage P74-26]ABU97045.1 tape tail measure protein [Thermus phage P74-26]